MTRTLLMAGCVLTCLTLNPVWAEQTIQPGEPIKASVAKGEWQYYTITPGADAELLTVELYQIAEDVDLFLKQGEQPDRIHYDCRQAVFGKRLEVCKLPVDKQEPVYIGIYGYSGGEFKVRATVERQVAQAEQE